jgi:hypothetical protein
MKLVSYVLFTFAIGMPILGALPVVGPVFEKVANAFSSVPVVGRIFGFLFGRGRTANNNANSRANNGNGNARPKANNANVKANNAKAIANLTRSKGRRLGK